MGVTSTITNAVSIPGTILDALLAPIGVSVTGISFVFVLAATSVLWGMTTKPAENQSWNALDYVIVVIASFFLSRSKIGGIFKNLGGI